MAKACCTQHLADKEQTPSMISAQAVYCLLALNEAARVEWVVRGASAIGTVFHPWVFHP